MKDIRISTNSAVECTMVTAALSQAPCMVTVGSNERSTTGSVHTTVTLSETSQRLLHLCANGVVFSFGEVFPLFVSFAYRQAVFVRGLKLHKVKPSLDTTRITSYAVDREWGLAKVGDGCVLDMWYHLCSSIRKNENAALLYCKCNMKRLWDGDQPSRRATRRSDGNVWHS